MRIPPIDPMPCFRERARLPTAKQWRFAGLLAAQCMSAADCYRATYPARRGIRSAQTEQTEAARLARHPMVVSAMERISAADHVPVKVARLQQQMRAREARRAVNRILRDGGRRAGVLLSGRELSGPHPEEHPRRQAWRVFLRAAQAVQKAKEPQLSAAEKIAIIFRYYGPPIVEPHLLLPPPSPPIESDPRLAEITEHVRVQQQAIEQQRAAKPEPEPESEPAGPQPGHFPHPALAIAIAATPVVTAVASEPAGRWEWIAVSGRFPPIRKRIWIAGSTGEDR